MAGTLPKLAAPRPAAAAPLPSQSLRSAALAFAPSARRFRVSVSGRARSPVIAMASGKEGNGAATKRTTLHDLYDLQGQSPWYDNLCRPVTDLLPYIANGVRGVTSNPTIFEKAISTSSAYDDQFKQLISAGKDAESAYWELVIKDIQDACKLFEPIYDETDGADGYVSVEVSPRLANETQGTVEAAKWLHKVVNRPNVYIKIPATAECVPSIQEVIANGISVNVTLIFSVARYEAVIDAYIAGLESSGLSDLSRVTSVASFFVSRVDSLIDKNLEKIGTPEALALRGKAAVAQAKLANQLYLKKFSGPRWEALVKKGAKKQRLLWASTSVKNPAYSDTLYVDPLIGPDTVSTMPDQALSAFLDHGTVARTIDANVSEAEGIYSALEKLGISWEEVGKQLEHEGVTSFKKSFDSLLTSLTEKGNALKTAANL
ncbi:transaldolase-like [Lolium rigidum]|uniref:transaldolase-like n=1 Tax=Lolium rigidum TaxID=89674 RepID=UPI001F5C73A5|nr:transaldolase-like [Lolium rigidum]